MQRNSHFVACDAWPPSHHITFKYYDSGHMIYLNAQELPKLKDNIAGLIDATAKPQDSTKE
jgi:hypothetical protein